MQSAIMSNITIFRPFLGTNYRCSKQPLPNIMILFSPTVATPNFSKISYSNESGAFLNVISLRKKCLKTHRRALTLLPRHFLLLNRLQPVHTINFCQSYNFNILHVTKVCAPHTLSRSKTYSSHIFEFTIARPLFGDEQSFMIFYYLSTRIPCHVNKLK